MKTGVLVMFLVFCSAAGVDAQGRHWMGTKSFSVTLRPYGEWVSYGDGFSVWRPHGVSHVWRPYTVGRWAWTTGGWYWVSYEPWGWVTYHYGRWYYDDYLGWVWVPDDEWAPAWVDWHCSGDYVGWAPMGPLTLVHFSVEIGPHPFWVTHSPRWAVVTYQQMAEPNIQNHLRPESDVRGFGNTRISGGDRRDVNPGHRAPDLSTVEERARVRISRIDVKAAEKSEELHRRTPPNRVMKPRGEEIRAESRKTERQVSTGRVQNLPQAVRAPDQRKARRADDPEKQTEKEERKVR